MASDAVKEFTDDNFDSDVLQADGAVLVDFWAPWCGPCRQIAPMIDELASENPSVSVGKVNIEDNTLRVIGDAFILTSDLTGKRARLEESVWHPEFGKDISNKMLLIELSRKRENISFIWAYT